jgi:hypothetical protein
MEQQREEELLRVEDAMRPYAGPTLDADELANTAVERASSSPEPVLLARRFPGYWYGFHRDTLKSAGPNATIVDLSSQEPLPILFPDTPLELALRSLRGHEVLPVLHRADQTKIEGVVTLELILKVYRETTDEN